MMERPLLAQGVFPPLNSHLKVPPQFNFFASLVLESFRKILNLCSIHCDLLADANILFSFVKSSPHQTNY